MADRRLSWYIESELACIERGTSDQSYGSPVKRPAHHTSFYITRLLTRLASTRKGDQLPRAINLWELGQRLSRYIIYASWQGKPTCNQATACVNSHESGTLHLVLLGCRHGYGEYRGVFRKEDWCPQTINITGDWHLTV